METHLTPAEWLEQVGQKAAAHDLMQEYGDYRARTAYNRGVVEALELAADKADIEYDLEDGDYYLGKRINHRVDKDSILNIKNELIKK